MGVHMWEEGGGRGENKTCFLSKYLSKTLDNYMD